ncbi:MAG: hypothetical protein MAG794_00534 [Gammaproteobacteria bacterium]|nr:hypothetical protein [Gammaproteobacteria bacterium]
MQCAEPRQSAGDVSDAVELAGIVGNAGGDVFVDGRVALFEVLGNQNRLS